MTREEIIEGLKLLGVNMGCFDELQDDKGKWIDVHELLFETIQALSQEPCDDAISRDAVQKEINCWIGSGEYRCAMSERFLIDRINELPSVTQKSGTAVLEQIRDAIEREADYQDAYIDADVAKGLYMALEIIDKQMK